MKRAREASEILLSALPGKISFLLLVFSAKLPFKLCLRIFKVQGVVKGQRLEYCVGITS